MARPFIARSQRQSSAGPSPEKPRRLAPLHNRNYALLWSASFVSNSGTWMQIVALGWLVYNLTNSPFYLGLVGFAKAAPVLVLPPMGGVMADRLPRLKLLKVTQCTSLALALILGFLVSTGLVQVWHIIVLSLLTGAVNAFDSPTQQALLPDLLSREEIASGIALNSAAWQGAALFGPALAGVAVASIGLAGAFYANAGSYLAVVAALFMMRGVPEHTATNRDRSIFGDLRDGLSYVRATNLVAALLVLAALTNLFGRSYQQFLPVFARDVLHVGASGLGWLTSAPGAGALVGAAFVATAGGIRRKGRLLFAGMLLFSCSLVLLAVSKSFALSLVALFLAGLTFILFSTMLNTMLQLEVPGNMRGRVMSLMTVTMQGFGPLGALVTGGIATATGTPAAVAIGAFIVICATLAAAFAVPAVRSFPLEVRATPAGSE
jgi:MFS family permease